MKSSDVGARERHYSTDGAPPPASEGLVPGRATGEKPDPSGEPDPERGWIRRVWDWISETFRVVRGEEKFEWSVLWWSLLVLVLGAALGVVLLKRGMFGHPRVFAEVWSDGIVLAPESPTNVVTWMRPRSGLRSNGTPFVGVDVDTQTLGSVFQNLAGRSMTRADLQGGATLDSALRGQGGTIRSLELSGKCELRVGLRGDGRIEILARLGSTPPDTGCLLLGELEMKAATVAPGKWGDPPALASFERNLEPGGVAALRFIPDSGLLPIRIGGFRVRGVGFNRPMPAVETSMIHGGVLRLPDFLEDGEASVQVLGRSVGRGHPVHRGDELDFGGLRNGRILEMEIGELIHVQLQGDAPDPSIAGESKQPNVLQHLNNESGLLWIAAFALGAVGLLLAILEVAR